MTTDIKLKIRDVEGLPRRVEYLDDLKNEIEIGPFTFVTGVVKDSISVGYPYQIMDPSYNLDVSGSLRVTEDARIQSNLFVRKEVFVNGSTFFKTNVSVLGDTELNTLNTIGNTTLQSQLIVNGTTFLKNVTIVGACNMNDLRVNESLNIGGNVSVSGTTYIGGLLTLQNDLTSYSDKRIKKNITPLSKCLDHITHIHGYRFQKKDQKDDSYSIGLIAQELEENYPELVTEVKVGEEWIKTVHYQAFTGVLLECIQELKEKITLLENKIFK